MVKRRVLDSVIPRLVACLVVGGLAVAAGWSWVQRPHREALLQLEITRQLVTMTRELQSVLRELAPAGQDTARHAMSVFASAQQVHAMRLRAAGEPPVVLGDWPSRLAVGAETWSIREDTQSLTQRISFTHPTVLQAPFAVGKRTYMLELLVDGPAIAARHHEAMSGQFVDDAILVAILTLGALLLLRRWVALPLAEVVELVRVGGNAQTFAALARRQRGEFRELSGSIGQTLDALQRANALLAEREAALETLYQLAPAAMISIEPDGTIVDANQAAGELLGGGSAEALLGRPVVDLLQVEDRGLLPQAVGRLRTEDHVRCHLRVRHAPERPLIHLAVQATAVRRDDGGLDAARLSLTDVTPLKDLQDQLQEKTRLLDLLVDHMPDAVVLADEAGAVLASNRQAMRLLGRHGGRLLGTRVDSERFWDALGILEPEHWAQRLDTVAAQPDRAFQERLATRGGAMLVQATPVRDAAGRVAGRLWVLQDAALQEQSEKQLQQQKQQLRALHRVGPALIDVRSVDLLLQRTLEQVHAEMGVDAVGLAVRDGSRGRRTRQLLHRGKAPYLLPQNVELLDAVETALMPHVFAQTEALFWPDLEVVGAPWAKRFIAAGFTSLAAAPVRAAQETAGVFWIAQRGGERLEPRQIHLLETLCPLLAARLEIAQLGERLQGLHLADPVTDLPSHLQFERALAKMAARPGRPCAILVLDLDHFSAVNAAHGRAGGDVVLHAIAGRLLSACRKSGFIARFAGASFGLIIPDVEPGQVDALAERLRAVIGRDPVSLTAGGECAVTASVGAACFPADGVRADELLDLAVIRVTRAKRTGTGVVSTGPDASRRAG